MLARFCPFHLHESQAAARPRHVTRAAADGQLLDQPARPDGLGSIIPNFPAAVQAANLGAFDIIISTYTPAGRLQTRTWARSVAGQPLVTTYTYSLAGDLFTVDYSDATPDVTYGYDRQGRQTTVTQSGGTTLTRRLDDAGPLRSETFTGGPLDGLTVTNTYDPLQRRTHLTLLRSGSPLLQHTYTYANGRLHAVSDGPHTATYSYVANSPLVEQIQFTANGQTVMTTTRAYDKLNRLTAIASVPAAAAPVSFAYAYNAASQRTALTNADASRWTYEYDALGQVTSGKKYGSDGSPVAGQQFAYAFDDIGNRRSATRDGRTADYTANQLNQYTARTVPGFVNILGEATNTATVSVLTEAGVFPTTRHGDYWRAELAVSNSVPLWLALTNLAVLNQGTNADLIATNRGHLLVPQSPETFTYDADGNLTADSLWTNTWNAENRRTVIESRPSVPAAARVRVQWTHLPDGRWIERIVSTNDGTAYQPAFTNRYVWDGNVLLAVLNHTNGLELSFLRGLDLSGTPQGAGGVGGLLFVGHFASAIGYHAVACDGNGNVAALVDAADGTESARYEYGPFGEPLRITGPMGKVNPLRFSTQFADDWTGDLKYLYRDYRPDLGRWPSPDPIEERGGENVYGFGRNSAVTGVDVLGNSWYNPYSWIYDPEKFVSHPPLDLLDEKTRTVNVGKCQIVVLLGHAKKKRPWKWNMHQCSGGAAIMCWPNDNSIGLDGVHDLWPTDLEKPDDEFVLWGDDLAPNPENPYEAQFGRTILADAVFDAVRGNALKRAGELCRDGCCKQVQIRFIWVEGKKRIHNPTNKQTDYEGKTRIQDMGVNCNPWSYSYVDR
jgi:RHS repeat-associated protein